MIIHQSLSITSSTNYIFVDDAIESQPNAEAYCQNTYGSNLASIHSIEDLNEINTLLSNDDIDTLFSNCWIGYFLKKTDINQGGWLFNSAWTDDSYIDNAWTINNWAPGEPNNWGGIEDCAAADRNHDYKWNDVPCGWQLPFICNRYPKKVSENYILIQQNRNFDDAETFCNDHYTTNLASIHTDIQNDEINELCGVCWIGLSIDNDINGWKWNDGSTFDYNAWYELQPNDDDCAQVHGQGQDNDGWYEYPCSDMANSFVCNRPNEVRYIGCYKDTVDRALRYGPHDWGYNRYSCSTVCKNYKYFALQAGGGWSSWCSCDNDLSHAIKYGSSDNCPTNQVGGAFLNDIFENL